MKYPSRTEPRPPLIALVAATAFFVACGALVAADTSGFRAPQGFEVSLYAGDDLAHDIFSMTIDAQGRVVVAGKGYVKVLHDDDGDGRADRATLFSDWPREGARGMYFDGDDLVCAGDRGLHRIHDRDGDGIADGTSERWLPCSHGGDHAANGIVKGPDGWFYWIGGNDAGFGSAHAELPGSPVRKPVGGALVRVAPDGSASEIYADGFRNPYDLDIGPFGEVFTYDADGERDQHLPWYSPTRIFDIAQGMHHGWVLEGWQHAWNRPSWWPDSVERLAEVGRGSPTGVLVYRHRAFPERYRNGLFAICWSYGRIYFFPLERRGATYATELEVFMEPRGDTGFAPVDMAVGPSGDIYVAIGGRGTRGSVFRVHHGDSAEGVPTERERNATPPGPVRRVLRAPEPLASWSRVHWVPAARELGRAPFEEAASDVELPLLERVRALEILVELFGGISPQLADARAFDGSPELAARAIWALSRSPDSPEARGFLARRTHRSEPRVLRAAWEALAALPSPLGHVKPEPAWLDGLEHPDRRVRAAAVLAARGPGRESFARAAPNLDRLRSPRQVLGYLRVHGPPSPEDASGLEEYFDASLGAFDAAKDGPPARRVSVRIEAVRLLQIALGDVALVQDRASVGDGFVGRHAESIERGLRARAAERLISSFPSGERRLDREMSRLFAMLAVEVDGLLARLSRLFAEESAVEEDIHHLLAAAQIPGERPEEFTERSAAALARLHSKMAAGGKEPSRFWPVRVGDAFDALRARDPRLVETLSARPEFGLADHALFIQRLPHPEKMAALGKVLERARREAETFAWTTELVALAGEAGGEEDLDLLRAKWSDPALRDAIALALARRPAEVDRARLVEALDSPRRPVVARAASALASLSARAAPEELLVALESLRRFCALEEAVDARRALDRLLRHWSGEHPSVEEGPDAHAAYEPWFVWFRKAYPEWTDGLSVTDAGVGALLDRLDSIAWEEGDASRGRTVFQARGCEHCHAGASRLGPDLRGVASRLSRRDLFIAIGDPSRDVSPAHASKEVVTASGSTYSGIMIYQSPAATLLQVSPDTTVRFEGKDVIALRESSTSFMPAGLLAGAADRELADLYAYLKTLEKK